GRGLRAREGQAREEALAPREGDRDARSRDPARGHDRGGDAALFQRRPGEGGDRARAREEARRQARGHPGEGRGPRGARRDRTGTQGRLTMMRWSKGGEGAVLSVDDDRVTVRSTVPAAPGSRLAGALPSGCAVRIKVARCRADAGAFVIEGKLLDATR